jgi:hypothetical protein
MIFGNSVQMLAVAVKLAEAIVAVLVGVVEVAVTVPISRRR